MFRRRSGETVIPSVGLKLSRLVARETGREKKKGRFPYGSSEIKRQRATSRRRARSPAGSADSTPISSGIALAGSALYSVAEGWRHERAHREEGINGTGGKGKRETGRGGDSGAGVGGRRKAGEGEMGGGGGMGEGEDENIYLAASTVLKTAVVHFAELPRETASSGGGSRDGG